MKKVITYLILVLGIISSNAQDLDLSDVFDYARKVGMSDADRQLLMPMVIGSFEGNSKIVYENASKLSDKGYSIGDYFLGWCYEGGENVSINFKKAQEYFNKAATHAFPFNWAYRSLGFSYFDGYNGNQDYKEALKWFSKATDEIKLDAYKGQSYLVMGMIYQGHGNVSANEDLEFMYIKKSAELGWPWGEEKLGELLITSQKYGNKNEAIHWIEKAAKDDMANSQFYYGLFLFEGGNESEGIKYIKKAAKQGIFPAMQFLDEYNSKNK